MKRKSFKSIGELVKFICTLNIKSNRNYYINFNKSIFIFIRKNNKCVDNFKFKIDKNTDKRILIEKLKRKISPYQTSFYDYKFKFFVITNNDKLFFKFLNMYLKCKIKKFFFITLRDYINLFLKRIKKVIDYLVEKTNNFLSKEPIKKIAVAISFIFSLIVLYIITLMFFNNLTPYEINSEIIYLIIQMLAIFIIIFLGIVILYLFVSFLLIKEWRKYLNLFFIYFIYCN